jgi:ubiquinone/menaquinone biosynthesis C-methylase UbiE
MELQAGMTVADFGCGTGYFSLPIAKKIGEEGVVYALDILPEKLEVIESQVKMRNITNIIAKRVNLENKEGSQLGAGSADWVIMKDVLFQNKNKNQMLMEAKRILKDGGKILIIEWKKENTPIGPDNKIRISKEELKKLIIENGLGILKEINAGNFHYCLILIK